MAIAQRVELHLTVISPLYSPKLALVIINSLLRLIMARVIMLFTPKKKPVKPFHRQPGGGRQRRQ